MPFIPDKEQKAQFKPIASKDPDKYYPTEVLREHGFVRKHCKCGTFFWTVNENQSVCGDPVCSGGFRFYTDNPCKKKLDYVSVWLEFSKMFKEFGYTPIKRYPVVARWNPTMEYTNASIAAFQPYVISGQVKPPANPLVIPQFCLRFDDTDNVGITGMHHTGFVMIGQHAFVPPSEWDQNSYFRHILSWLNKGLGLPNKEITFHEDAWAGGGNFGCCMEYFSRGVELGNQVYMLYEQTASMPRELKIKALDMGMGMERNAWFSQATPTIYDAVFPTVMKKLLSASGFKYDAELIKRYMPYGGYLNIDEVKDIDKAWQTVAQKAGTTVKELKKNLLPLSALYSIADHTRALLFALNDGALPSNVGGGYNLRLLVRRALSFIEQYGWNIYLPDVCAWHAEYLKPVFPELMDGLEQVRKILDVEEEKFKSTRQKSRLIIQNIIETKQKIDAKKLLELYDSQGISPEMIREEAMKAGQEVIVPENFYKLVAERHEKTEHEAATHREEYIDFGEIPETDVLYYDDYLVTEFKAKVIAQVGKNIVLDKTFFYPTSGGQMHDTGFISGERVVDVFQQGKVIVHVLESEHEFPVGSEVPCKIDKKRREQLAQHHTATHIVNVAARRVLGNHINQAGAKKSEDKAHLDITHYQSISAEELALIEKEANKIVRENLDVHMSFMPRNDAEKKYGMSIYQGGAVPGDRLRIVEIPEVDVECCAGTHLHKTSEVGEIKILKTTKVQDGVVRITFTAGKAAEKVEKVEGGLVEELCKILDVPAEKLPARCEELFDKWKKAKKIAGKKKVPEGFSMKELDLISTDAYEGDVLTKVADVFKTQPEHVVKTAQRFLDQLGVWKDEIKGF
ncbi:alanine--tRNA ligase [Candidatus Woesearchaeota archaeon]|nr:alanine--tRNA ligase [Candidatus Woesearchaeota archaeon]